MKHLLIVYASQTGHALQMALAALRGAKQLADEVEIRFEHGLRANADDLLWCHGLLLATPENFGYMAGAMKDFLDRTYYPAQGKVEGLPFAVMISAGNDGSGAVREIGRIANGYRWKSVAEALIVRNPIAETHLIAAEELGEAMAAGLAMGIF